MVVVDSGGPGDLIEVKITTLDTHDTDGNELDEPTVEADLDQEPLTEGALVAIENRTGRILAMVGGYDFERSKFNRATQAYRQLGSLFKGVLYAAAIDRGFTPTTIIQDELTSYDVGPDQPLYEPRNYDHTYEPRSRMDPRADSALLGLLRRQCSHREQLLQQEVR